MDPFAVDLQLLRTVLLPDVSLALGRELMARVVSNGIDGRGSLSIAGMLVEAQLPDELQAGQELKLQVRELTADKVVFTAQAQDDPRSQAAAQVPQIPIDAPPGPARGDGRLQVQERPSSHGGDQDPAQATHTLALRYDAPGAGPVDMFFVLSPGVLHLQLTVASGAAFDTAQALIAPLDVALEEAAERSVTVSIKPRFDPVDIYA